jgi:hypothetical protein
MALSDSNLTKNLPVDLIPLIGLIVLAYFGYLKYKANNLLDRVKATNTKTKLDALKSELGGFGIAVDTSKNTAAHNVQTVKLLLEAKNKQYRTYASVMALIVLCITFLIYTKYHVTDPVNKNEKTDSPKTVKKDSTGANTHPVVTKPRKRNDTTRKPIASAKDTAHPQPAEKKPADPVPVEKPWVLENSSEIGKTKTGYAQVFNDIILVNVNDVRQSVGEVEIKVCYTEDSKHCTNVIIPDAVLHLNVPYEFFYGAKRYVLNLKQIGIFGFRRTYGGFINMETYKR